LPPGLPGLFCDLPRLPLTDIPGLCRVVVHGAPIPRPRTRVLPGGNITGHTGRRESRHPALPGRRRTHRHSYRQITHPLPVSVEGGSPAWARQTSGRSGAQRGAVPHAASAITETTKASARHQRRPRPLGWTNAPQQADLRTYPKSRRNGSSARAMTLTGDNGRTTLVGDLFQCDCPTVRRVVHFP
jgi:hypothetical protein